MNAETFLDQFGHLSEAPNGIPKLRELILQLAVRGKLVPQDSSDEPASELLKRIQAEKQRVIATGEVPKPRFTRTMETTAEPPFTVPVGWAWSILEEVSCYIQRGKGPKYVEQGDIPVVSQKCVQWNGFTMDLARFVDPGSLSKYGPERLLRTGDLLWNSTGTGTIGRVNVYEHDTHGYEKVVADSHVTVVRPLFIDSRFVWTFLASPDVQDGFEDRASGSTNQIELSTTAVRTQRIPIAPLAEQKRIVAKVDELMALCDELEAKQQAVRTKQIAFNRSSLNALTKPNGTSLSAAWHRVRDHFNHLYTVPETVDDLRQTILQLAVMGRLVPQDPNDEPASELLKRIQAEKQRLVAEGRLRKSSPLPPIEAAEIAHSVPDGWQWVRLGEWGDWGAGATPMRGHPHYFGGKMPWFKSGELGDSEHLSDSEEHVTALALQECSLRVDQPGDVLIAMYGATIGRLGILEVTATTNQAVCACTCFRGIFNRYLFLTLRALRSGFTGQGAGGAQPNISKVKIVNTQVPLPPHAEQKRIVAKVDQLMTLCEVLETKLQQSRIDADSLLTAIVHELIGSQGGEQG